MGLAEPEFWTRVCNDLGLVAPVQPLWHKALAKVYKENSALLDWARGLPAQGIRLALLTNTEPPSRDFHLSLGYNFFDARVFSCDEGLAKPDPRIYALAAKRLQLPAEYCLMVDDRKENLDGAQQAGMQTFHFVGQDAMHNLTREVLL